jgi:hypothetical protein
MIGGCPVFPPDNIWNRRIDSLPVDTAHSAAYINSIGANTGLHPDFGTVYGIPYGFTPTGQQQVTVTFQYDDESDPGPYYIPSNAPIEGGSDSHVLIADPGRCALYELYAATKINNTTWRAGSGAIFDLRSNVLRPDGWTSADAAGLPILPGLVRYDEAAAGAIHHAIRFTADITQKAYVWPARHYASDNTSLSRPPMGARFRLKASFNIDNPNYNFSPEVKVILRAFKEYGIILADNGSNWYITGAPDSRWSDDDLHDLSYVKGSDFEAVDVSSLMVNPNSGQSK